MTEILMWENFNSDEKKIIEEKGYLEVFSDNYPPYKITKKLIEDGRKHLLMRKSISIE